LLLALDESGNLDILKDGKRELRFSVFGPSMLELAIVMIPTTQSGSVKIPPTPKVSSAAYVRSAAGMLDRVDSRKH
jgi:hypothetical protein